MQIPITQHHYSQPHLSFPYQRVKMDKYLAEYRDNLLLIDRLMWPLNQNFLKPSWQPKNLIPRFLFRWQMWYGCSWIGIYIYLIVGHGKLAGLALVSQQIWCLMTIIQMEAKVINGAWQKDKMLQLLKWCERLYTMDYGEDYATVVLSVFAKTNRSISFCVRYK